MEEEIVTLTRDMIACKEEAWCRFHERYYPLLLAQAIARGIPAADAPDIVQGVYLRVLRHGKAFRDSGNLEAWLACLTRCETIDAVRRSKRRSWLGERFQQWQEARRDVHAADITDLDQALESLDDSERRLLSRHYLEGWSQEEIASEQSTSTKAVESKLARLRRRLRGELENLNTCKS
ncbi:RNA polymerase sigma factor [Luteolibacter luteus]|uniref:Sigma-70 family RNA polymerase sigma factor n=1 Tax=Luteolibacter luteus TaxID=2728835 RepID=A0A858RE29_9BACT|nr:sigma-70 family RNA polymerase sigma factor [Luteolibacter luteus]QJE94861.1 sigma-70 family RNA polymerase sigma factor [Luteolibacter luteus]